MGVTTGICVSVVVSIDIVFLLTRMGQFPRSSDASVLARAENGLDPIENHHFHSLILPENATKTA